MERTGGVGANCAATVFGTVVTAVWRLAFVELMHHEGCARSLTAEAVIELVQLGRACSSAGPAFHHHLGCQLDKPLWGMVKVSTLDLGHLQASQVILQAPVDG